MDIEGTWNSKYEYGRGTNDEPQYSEHQISFALENNIWRGASLPSEDSSEVHVSLIREGNQFRGEWTERTSPNETKLEGIWLGVSSLGERVKSGTWLLTR